MQRLLLSAALALSATTATAQVSVEEAQRRLEERAAQRTPTTKPTAESLEAEVRRLKSELSVANATVDRLRRELAALREKPQEKPVAKNGKIEILTGDSVEDAVAKLKGKGFVRLERRSRGDAIIDVYQIDGETKTTTVFLRSVNGVVSTIDFETVDK